MFLFLYTILGINFYKKFMPASLQSENFNIHDQIEEITYFLPVLSIIF